MRSAAAAAAAAVALLVLLEAGWAAAEAPGGATGGGGPSSTLEWCRAAEVRPTVRQCRLAPCFKVMPERGQHSCCCMARAQGWELPHGKCDALKCAADVAPLFRVGPVLLPPPPMSPAGFATPIPYMPGPQAPPPRSDADMSGAPGSAFAPPPAPDASLRIKLDSVAAACSRADFQPSRRQCLKASCFSAMPAANQRMCCCGSTASGWAAQHLSTACNSTDPCPSAMPSSLSRRGPLLSDRLRYGAALRRCSAQCVDKCTTALAGSTGTGSGSGSGGGSGSGSGNGGVTLEKCEDECVDSCMQGEGLAGPQAGVADAQPAPDALVELAAGFAPGDIAALRNRIAQLQRHHQAGHRTAKAGAAEARTSSVSPAQAAVGGEPAHAAAEHGITAPVYADQQRFSTVRHKSGARAKAEAGVQGGKKWWLDPPPWWLPPPPEWGSAPPTIHSDFFTPYHAPQNFGMSPGYNWMPAYSPTPLPY